jgi:hypothetical protein
MPCGAGPASACIYTEKEARAAVGRPGARCGFTMAIAAAQSDETPPSKPGAGA